MGSVGTLILKSQNRPGSITIETLPMSQLRLESQRAALVYVVTKRNSSTFWNYQFNFLLQVWEEVDIVCLVQAEVGMS